MGILLEVFYMGSFFNFEPIINKYMETLPEEDRDDFYKNFMSSFEEFSKMNIQLNIFNSETTRCIIAKDRNNEMCVPIPPELLVVLTLLLDHIKLS